MKKRRTPQEKKALSYDKDHKITYEYPKSYRRMHHRRKQYANQGYRRKIATMLDNLENRPPSEELEEVYPETVRREKVRKYGGLSLREWVKGRLERRRRLEDESKNRQKGF